MPTPTPLRSIDGANPYRGFRSYPAFTDDLTKWDLLGDADREALDRTAFKDSSGGPGACSGCRESLSTEGAIARHFTLPDARYWNVGNCPNVKGPHSRGLTLGE